VEFGRRDTEPRKSLIIGFLHVTGQSRIETDVWLTAVACRHTDRLIPTTSHADVFAFLPRGGAHVAANNTSGQLAAGAVTDLTWYDKTRDRHNGVVVVRMRRRLEQRGFRFVQQRMQRTQRKNRNHFYPCICYPFLRGVSVVCRIRALCLSRVPRTYLAVTLLVGSNGSLHCFRWRSLTPRGDGEIRVSNPQPKRAIANCSHAALCHITFCPCCRPYLFGWIKIFTFSFCSVIWTTFTVYVGTGWILRTSAQGAMQNRSTTATRQTTRVVTVPRRYYPLVSA